MINRSVAACGLFLLAFTHPLACQTSSSAADLVVFGRIWTGDSSRPWAQALAAVGDTVTAVGDSTRIVSAIGPKTRVLANGKAMVVPGFMDGHVHFLSGGFQLPSVDLRDAGSPAEFIRRLQRYAANLKPGEWILGGDWTTSVGRARLCPIGAGSTRSPPETRSS
jgi:predicted amidohydrolase YtcJ